MDGYDFALVFGAYAVLASIWIVGTWQYGKHMEREIIRLKIALRNAQGGHFD